MTDPTPRPSPVLRKEVVVTEKWGELVVRQLMTSERIVLGSRNAPEPAEGAAETEADKFIRTRRDYALFLADVMALAVTDKQGAAMYSASDWDIFTVTDGQDCLLLLNKALSLNGFKTLGGEDVAKNA